MINIFSASFWMDSLLVAAVAFTAALLMTARREGEKLTASFLRSVKLTIVLFAVYVLTGNIAYLMKLAGVFSQEYKRGHFVIPLIEFKIDTAVLDYWMKFSLTWIALPLSVLAFAVIVRFAIGMARERARTPVAKQSEEKLARVLNKGCPPLDLLDAKREEYVEQHGSELEDELMRALFEYGLDFVSLKNIDEGPMVTRFTFDLEAGRKISEITKYQQELAMFLGVENLNMQPSRDGLVVEMPNRVRRKVSILETLSKCGAGKKPLALPLGLTVSGELLSVDLEKAPHLLIAGATGSGKSVCLNSILTGILLSSTPDETRLILIDPKRVELYSYEGIPHLLMPVVYEHEKVAKVLDWCVYEMEKRYELFAKAQARDINLYNAKASERLPRIVIVLDELADLMLTVKDEIEQGVLKLGQKARAAGIHMIVATQRPSTDIVTGTIKANLPTRIAFATSTQADSRVILDENGAEKLLGEGDGLLMTTQTRTLVRFQGAYVSEAEIERISEWWRKKGAKSAYRAEIDWEPDEAESVQEEEASNKCGSGCNADMKLAQKRCESADVVKDSHYEVLKRFIAELEPEETESETYLPPLREIAERLGMSTKRVFETVKLLESEGMIEKVGEGSRMARYRRRAG